MSCSLIGFDYVRKACTHNHALVPTRAFFMEFL